MKERFAGPSPAATMLTAHGQSNQRDFIAPITLDVIGTSVPIELENYPHRQVNLRVVDHP
jgi:hypothetical protein